MTMIDCKGCGKPFERPVQRGRPAVRCTECRAKDNPSLENKELPAEVGAIPSEEMLSEETPAKKPDPEVGYPQLYRLMVGNMGLAYAGEDPVKATTEFNAYARRSSMGFGQVGFEAVQLWKLNREKNCYELEKEFIPKRELQ
jgi:hypothetical protein